MRLAWEQRYLQLLRDILFQKYSTIQIVYEKTKESRDEINDDLEAAGGNGVIVQRNPSTLPMYALIGTFTWQGSSLSR